MKKETKKIIVNGNGYEFYFSEELNMWRILENNLLVDHYAADLEIDLANLDGTIDWNEITDFIGFITGNRQNVNDNIKTAQFVLLSFFKAIYKKAYSDEFMQDIVFDFTGIDYKGAHKDVNFMNSFEYDFFFFPYNTRNAGEDVGSCVWTASFRNNIFLGVHRDL